MILAPLVGIILNLLDASEDTEFVPQNDVVGFFASMDCPGRVHCGFQLLLDYNWVCSLFTHLCLSLTLLVSKLLNFLRILVSFSSFSPLFFLSLCSSCFAILVFSIDSLCLGFSSSAKQPRPFIVVLKTWNST